MATGQWFASESGGNGIWALSESTSSAATVSAAYGTPTSGTTATVGCTTDTASGTLYAVITQSATTPSAAQIKAGQDHTGAAADWADSGGVSSTSPSLSATGLTANTEYWTHVVQTVASVDSNVDTSDSSWWTDNTGGGGGSLLEINPAAGSLRFTGYVPTVARTANQWVAPGAGSLVFTGYVPTVDRTGSRDVAPSSGALRFTGYAPGILVEAGGSQTIEPATGALRFTGYAPTVTVSATRRSVRATGPGYSEQRRMRWENEEVEKPAAADLASISMILATLLEVGVFNG